MDGLDGTATGEADREEAESDDLSWCEGLYFDVSIYHKQ